MDWTKKIPPWTSQYSVPNRVDAMDCVSESLVNIVYMLTGFDGSPRALAKLANTTPTGSYQFKVMQEANENGLVYYSLWPSPPVFDWNTYYAELPKDLTYVKVKISLLPADLSVSPLWTILKFSNGAQHAVAQINDTQYFDSEAGDEIKPLNYLGAEIVSQISLKVTITLMDDGFFKAKDGSTIVYFHKIGDPSELTGIGKLIKVPVPAKDDGSPDFDKLTLTNSADI